MFKGTLPKHAQKTLALLGKPNILPKDTYLAGGSALALQIGHRRSVDFDFFTNTYFDTKEIKEKLKKLGDYQEEQETTQTMVGKFNQVKFSLFYYLYNLVKKPTKFFEIKIASKEDIAAMKLVAITGRGTKKDFVDLYFLATRFFTIEEMFDFYNRKYHNLKHNLFTLLKALQYFEDAEQSEMPIMIKKISWEKIKKFFQKEVIRLTKKYI